jgi:hypothetical protein
MPMTLSDMLALLPDNTTGEISPADMRAIVTDLYNAANSEGTAYAYRWTTGATPASGQLTMDQPWLITATKALISETTDDGLTLGFTVVDNAAAARLWITNAAGAKLVADVTGASVDMGTYRELPITVTSIAGAAPINNAAVTGTLFAVLP